jgi:mono/diheme cytochrome c family protein
MRWHIALGTLSVLLLVAVFGYLAVGEQTRMQAFTEAFDARQIETGATLFETHCRTCHGPQGKGIIGVAPAINAPDLFNGERLAAVGFSGTLTDYLEGVISAGRPVPSAGTSYPQRMPTWAQAYGGPLRKDQIDSLVAFIENWEDRALADGGTVASAPSGQPIGTDITVSLPAGDPEQGAALAQSAQGGCSACHELAAVGPAWARSGEMPGIATRAVERINETDYTGSATTAQQYLVESIVAPNVFVVPGYGSGIMPQDYAQRLTARQVADLIAYMETLP